MLDLSLYLDQAMKYLTNQDLEGFNNQFMYQKDILNSQDYNYTMQNIEENLEILYEKSRLIEALIAYANEFIKTNVYDISDECESILKNIENNIDSIREKNYISTEVEFECSTGSYLDRDGTVLKECAVYEHKLTLSTKDNNELKIKSVSLTNNLTPYRNNLENLKINELYRSFYILDGPVKDGLKEEIHIELVTPSPLNKLDIITSNCSVEYIEFENENGTKDHIAKDFNITHSTRTVKSIIIVLNATNYDTLTYYVDEARSKTNYWMNIKENIYDTITGSNKALTQAELDELTGMADFKKAYDEYCKNVEHWIEKRKAVADANKANGYYDEVETVDFIVPPSNINTYTNITVASTHDELKKDYSVNAINSNIISTDTSLNKKNISKKQNFYPDSEIMKYQQAYSEALPQYISKTGQPINMYFDTGKQLSYK